MIKHTGIRVSEEDRQNALQAARGAISFPPIKVHGKWMPEEMRASFGDWLDCLAQSYGLPAPEKTSEGEPVHYGMTNDGEFTSWEADPDECPAQDILGT